MYNLEQLYNEGTKWLEDIHFNTFLKPSRLLYEVYHRKQDRYYITEMCSHCLKDVMERDSIVYVVKEGRYRTSDEYQMEHFGDILPVV